MDGAGAADDIHSTTSSQSSSLYSIDSILYKLQRRHGKGNQRFSTSNDRNNNKRRRRHHQDEYDDRDDQQKDVVVEDGIDDDDIEDNDEVDEKDELVDDDDDDITTMIHEVKQDPIYDDEEEQSALLGGPSNDAMPVVGETQTLKTNTVAMDAISPQQGVIEPFSTTTTTRDINNIMMTTPERIVAAPSTSFCSTLLHNQLAPKSELDDDDDDDSNVHYGPFNDNAFEESMSTSMASSMMTSHAHTAAATTSMVRSPSIKRDRPDLFFWGIVVKVNGYTTPDNETIKRMLQRHGGDFETYETARVTHIIAENLSTAKANVYKGQRRPRPVCTPSWIVDSVQAGKLLPHGQYLLQELRDQQQQQQQHQPTIQSMFLKKPDQFRRQDEEEKSSTAQHMKPTSSFDIENLGRPSLIRETSHFQGGNEKEIFGKGKLQHKEQGEEEEEEESLLVIHREANEEETVDAMSPRKGLGKTDEKFINGKIRTIGTDPNFLESYFATSRLSFIGSHKQRSESVSAVSSPSKNTSTPFHETIIPAPALSSNARRLVFHVDMDCFFASVALRNYPQYQNKPVAISHYGKRNDDTTAPNSNGYRSISSRYDPVDLSSVSQKSTSECATCNYEARKYGIKKGMFLGRAKQLCPDLIVLAYDFKGYEEVSQQVLEILNRVATDGNYNGRVESVSCDEAYVELYFGGDVEYMEGIDHRAFEVAEQIRTEIFETTQCTATIGVAANKFLAKLGTDKVKPNRSFVVRDYKELLQDLKLRDLHGVGWRTEPKLTEAGLVTVQDIWDLGTSGERELIRILGTATGKKIFAYCHGKDDRPVKVGERKTVGAECNYGVRFDGPYGMDHFMYGLAKEVGRRMENIRVKGRRFTLKIKQRKNGAQAPPKFLGHGSCHNLSKSIDIPGSGATRDPVIMKNLGMTLYHEMAVELHDVRGMGIVISKLTEESESADSSSSLVNTSGIQNWFKDKVQPSKCDVAHSMIQDTGASEVVNMQYSQSEMEMQEPNDSLESLSKRIETGDDISHFREYGEKEMHSEQDELLPSQVSLENEVIVIDDVRKSNEAMDVESFYTESVTQIDLPPMSQIRLSQVEALPHNLKQHILAKMKDQDEANAERFDATRNNNSDEDNDVPSNAEQGRGNLFSAQDRRFRQTNLKRMMKLQTIQSGKEDTGISLTQFEELPLEIRLQIANQDNFQVGVLSQRDPPARSKGGKGRPARKSTEFPRDYNHQSNPESILKTTHNNQRHDVILANKIQPSSRMKKGKRKRKRAVVFEDVDLFHEDILPLNIFLDENSPDISSEALDRVIEFLTAVLKEGRVRTVVTMIRSIQNRREGTWNHRPTLERIVGSIDAEHVRLYGTHLDVPWLLREERETTRTES